MAKYKISQEQRNKLIEWMDNRSEAVHLIHDYWQNCKSPNRNTAKELLNKISPILKVKVGDFFSTQSFVIKVDSIGVCNDYFGQHDFYMRGESYYKRNGKLHKSKSCEIRTAFLLDDYIEPHNFEKWPLSE